MGASRRRRKNSRREATTAGDIDAVPDEVLELVFLRLPSPTHLDRAASTCRRWRRVIAGDGGRFLRRFGSLHGASSRVVGHYRVQQNYGYPCRPSRYPVFVPSSPASPWADTAAARNLALGFLPRGEFGDCCWELADVRAGLLLLFDGPTAPNFLICHPLTRRYRKIPRSAWFHGCTMLGAFLLDGDDDDGGGGTVGGISLSNFRVACTLFRVRDRNARACTFSSASGGWTSAAARSSTPVCPDGEIALIKFAGSTDGSAYWTVGDNIVLALDKDAAELSTSVLPDDEYTALRDKRHATEYALQLPWPPTIEACLP